MTKRTVFNYVEKYRGAAFLEPYNNIRMSKSKSRKKINNYIIHLDEPLGSGAYAHVYKAHDDHSNTLFAVKVI